jgi:hypothetical protein
LQVDLTTALIVANIYIYIYIYIHTHTHYKYTERTLHTQVHRDREIKKDNYTFGLVLGAYKQVPYI